MKEFANAKINLGLNVVGEREDGYHLLDMIMVPLTLGDEIDIELSDQDCFSSNTSLGWDKGNLMYRAVELLRQKYGVKEHFHITLDKRIPMQAGLAGGSADCRAVLRAVNQLCQLDLSLQELMDLGVTLGADVPFCLFNKPARVKGIGEDVRGISIKKKYHVLLIKPEEGVSTAEVFRAYKPTVSYDMDALENRLCHGEKLPLGNALEQPAMEILPQIRTIKQQCLDLGYDDVLMSGSGSCVFVLSTRKRELNKIYSYMKNIYSFVIMSEIKAF